MRAAFVDTLTGLARQDRDIWLITADTGFTVFDDYQNEFPDRYLNIGLSEGAMIGVAAGLALSGKRVFLYGIVPFVTNRCLDQIRNDLCLHNLPVAVVGVGQGLTYGAEGATHHAIEDIAVLSAMPGMTVVCPGDPVETEQLTAQVAGLSGPCYLRLGKSGEPIVHHDPAVKLRLGRGFVLREGGKTALIATGNMVAQAVTATDLLCKSGYDPWLVSMHTVKPIDRELVGRLASECDTLFTIEEHNRIGGLGDRVAEVLGECETRPRHYRLAVPDCFVTEGGGHRYLRERVGLLPEQMVQTIIARLGSK